MFFTVSWNYFKAYFFQMLKFAFGYGANFLKDNNLTFENQRFEWNYSDQYHLQYFPV